MRPDETLKKARIHALKLNLDSNPTELHRSEPDTLYGEKKRHCNYCNEMYQIYLILLFF